MILRAKKLAEHKSAKKSSSSSANNIPAAAAADSQTVELASQVNEQERGDFSAEGSTIVEGGLIVGASVEADSNIHGAEIEGRAVPTSTYKVKSDPAADSKEDGEEGGALSVADDPQTTTDATSRLSVGVGSCEGATSAVAMKEGFGEASSGEGMSLLGGTSSSNGTSGHDGGGRKGDSGDGEVVVRMQEAGDSNSSNSSSSSSNHQLPHKKEGVHLQPSYRHCQKNHQLRQHKQFLPRQLLQLQCQFPSLMRKRRS